MGNARASDCGTSNGTALTLFLYKPNANEVSPAADENMQSIRTIDDIKNLELQIVRYRMSGWTFVFRGQSDASWPIQTTLFRKYGASWNGQETWNTYVNEYKSKKNTTISEDILAYKPIRENEDFYALTMFRHLGFPCHLIDWSACLRTAVLFACAENNDKDGSLWVLSTRKKINDSPITYSPFDVDKPVMICKEFDLIPPAKNISDFPIGRIKRFRQNGFISIIPCDFLSYDFETLLDGTYSLKKFVIPMSSLVSTKKP